MESELKVLNLTSLSLSIRSTAVATVIVRLALSVRGVSLSSEIVWTQK